MRHFAGAYAYRCGIRVRASSTPIAVVKLSSYFQQQTSQYVIAGKGSREPVYFSVKDLFNTKRSKQQEGIHTSYL